MSKPTRGAAALAAVLTLGAIAAPVANAASVVTIRPSDLIPALSDTRSAGHVEFLGDGIHAWTDDATSNAKAAEYFALSGPIPSTASMEWFGTQPQAGQQLVFDVDGVDGNGNDWNILVGEPVYGANWWLTNGSSADAKAVDPSGANDGGNGSIWFGTLAEWGAALPNARVYAGGFSLGSGVKGDGVIHSITYGGTTYGFTSNPSATTTIRNVHGTSSVVRSGPWRAGPPAQRGPARQHGHRQDPQVARQGRRPRGVPGQPGLHRPRRRPPALRDGLGQAQDQGVQERPPRPQGDRHLLTLRQAWIASSVIRRAWMRTMHARLVLAALARVDLAVVVGMAGVAPGQPVEVVERAVGVQLRVAADLDEAPGVVRIDHQEADPRVGDHVPALVALERRVHRGVPAVDVDPDEARLGPAVGPPRGQDAADRAREQVQV